MPDLYRIRERIEQNEELYLSSFATKSRLARRSSAEKLDDLRTEFQRDRDRIIHTNAFRRIKHKTQVFIAPLGDHFATRLTHTLEVAQIGRTIARCLKLNEDLIEAIALGHDVGHGPFGHVGEEMLNMLYAEGFRHNEQSLRVLDILEKDGQGLNLTQQVKEGIVSHSKPRGDFMGESLESDIGLESQICRVSDAIAYINHDIADAVRAGVLDESDLPVESTEILGLRHSERINNMVLDVVQTSWSASGQTHSENAVLPAISMSLPIRNATNTLREFMFEKVYIPAGEGKLGHIARQSLELLYNHYSKHPEEIPSVYGIRDEPQSRQVVDYVSGMTDGFALTKARTLAPSLFNDCMFRGLW